MLLGFVIVMAAVFATGWWWRRRALAFYVAYVDRFGHYPRPEELALDRSSNPAAALARLFSADNFRFSQLFVPVADPHVDRLRQSAQAATIGVLAILVVALPTVEFVAAVTGGRELQEEWLLSVIGRSISLVVALSWWVRWLIARDQLRPTWWRLACLLGVVAGAIGYAYFIWVF